METQAITICGSEYRIPDFMLQVDSLPDDPDDSSTFVAQATQTAAYVVAYPVTSEAAMPLDKDLTIERVHGFLAENQGIIEVETGRTGERDYIYTIVKTLDLDGEDGQMGAQYILALEISTDDGAMHFQGFFEEIGGGAVRDTGVFMRRVEELGGIDEALEGWACDPYDADFDRGVLMTLAEHASYDDEFPEHALSMERKFVCALLQA